MPCSPRFALAAVAVGLIVPCAQASVIVAPVGDAPGPISHVALGDLQMTVALSVNDGTARTTFTNTSSGKASRAVIDEILIDTWDDDVGAAILSDPLLPDPTKQVAFSLARCNGLPGCHDQTTDPVPLVELRSDAPGPERGLGVGESLTVTFATALPDGSDIDDYLAAFDGGADTADYSIGFHALRAGGTASCPATGLYTTPEPAALAMLAGGVLVVLLRRRRR